MKNPSLVPPDMKEQQQLTSTRAAERRVVCIVALMTVVGGLLRVWGLGAKSLWLDEIITADVVRRGAHNIIEHCLSDVGPLPFSYLFVWVSQLVRPDEFFLRLPDCAFAIATIPLMFFLARRLSGRSDAGIVAALLLAASSYHHYYSQEARGYGLLVMLFAGMLYVLHVALERGRWVLWVAFIALAFAMTFTSYFGAISFGALIMYGLLAAIKDRDKRERMGRNLGWLIVAALVCGAAFFLWVARAYDAFREYGGSSKPAPHSIVGLVSYLGRALREFAGGTTISSVALYVFVVVAWLKSRGVRSARLLHLTILLSVLPLVAMYVSGVGHFLDPRFLIALMPVLVVSAAAGIVCAWESAAPAITPRVLVLVRVLIVLVVAVWMWSNIRGIDATLRTEKQDWRTAARLVEMNFRPGDFIVGGRNVGSLCISYYLHPDLRKAVLQDYYFYKPMRDLLSLDRRVWYVTAYYRNDVERPAFSGWLNENFQLLRVVPGRADPIHIFLSKTRMKRP